MKIKENHNITMNSGDTISINVLERIEDRLVHSFFGYIVSIFTIRRSSIMFFLILQRKDLSKYT